MRRLLLVLPVAAVAALLAFAYASFTAERQYYDLVRQGEDALARSKSSEAVEAFSGAIAIRSDRMLAWFKRGETYRARGELDAALRDLRQAVEIDPSVLPALEMLGDVQYDMGRYDRAAERYEAFLGVDDRSDTVLYKLALARFAEGQLEAATKALQRAVVLRPRFAEAYCFLGICLRAADNRADALAALNRAAELAPALLAAREELASLEAELGRPQAEQRHLEALVALDPDRPDRYTALALAYARAGRTDVAVTTLARATERMPDRPELLTALARVWLMVGERGPDRVALDKAIEASARVVDQSPTSETMALLGRSLLLAGKTGQALPWLQRAATRHPVDPLALPSLADAAERLGRVAEARDALVKHATLDGDRAPGALTAQRAVRIARLCDRLDDATGAAHWLERAIAASPGEPEYPAQLARVQWGAGLTEEALVTIGRARQRFPADQTLLDLERRFQASPRPRRRAARAT